MENREFHDASAPMVESISRHFERQRLGNEIKRQSSLRVTYFQIIKLSNQAYYQFKYFDIRNILDMILRNLL